jgi:glutamate--cysteine ligase
LRDLARLVVEIARDGLRARGRRDDTGMDEATYLAPLEAIAAGGPTQAEYWLARYRGEWQGDARRIFAEAAI